MRRIGRCSRGTARVCVDVPEAVFAARRLVSSSGPLRDTLARGAPGDAPARAGTTGALQMAMSSSGHRSRPASHSRAVRLHGHGYGCAGGWF